VKVYDEANGTTVYAISVNVDKTASDGTAYTIMATVASDQLGNPTVPPEDGLADLGVGISGTAGCWWGMWRGGFVDGFFGNDVH